MDSRTCFNPCGISRLSMSPSSSSHVEIARPHSARYPDSTPVAVGMIGSNPVGRLNGSLRSLKFNDYLRQ